MGRLVSARARVCCLTALGLSLAGSPAAGAPSVKQRVELSVSGGVYRLDPQGDQGDPERINHLLLGYQDATLGDIVLRASCALSERFALGLTLGVAPGMIHGRSAALISYRAELLFHLLTGPVRPFLSVGGGGLTLTTPPSILGTDTDPAVAWGAGIKIPLGRRFRLRFDFSHILTDGLSTVPVGQHFELGAGLAWLLQPEPAAPDGLADPDGDGVVGTRDRCPEEPEDPDGFADDDGCPDPDNDRDGVPDARDRCPVSAGVPPGGCPRPAQPTSRPAASLPRRL